MLDKIIQNKILEVQKLKNQLDYSVNDVIEMNLPKNSFIKYSGDIHISFLEPIKPGLDKDIFINILQDNIYNESEKLI